MSTVIDSLLVTLGLDTSQFKEGAKEAKRGLKDLEEEHGNFAEKVKEHGKDAQEFYGALIAKAGQLFAVLAGGQGFKQFMETTMEADKTTGKLAEMLGISVEALGEWHGAVLLADGTAAGFNSGIRSLAGSLVDIEKRLPRAARSLKVLQAAGVKGLSLGKKSDVMQVLDQLSERMKGMSWMESLRLGQRMGFDEGTIRMLRQGREKIAEAKAEMAALGLATKEDTESYEDFEDANKKLTASTTAVGRTLIALVLPALKWVVQTATEFSKWAHNHSDAVKAAFIGIAAVIGIVAVQAGIATTAMLGLNMASGGILIIVGALATGLTYLALKTPILEKFAYWIGYIMGMLKGLREIANPTFTPTREPSPTEQMQYRRATRKFNERPAEVHDVPYQDNVNHNWWTRTVGENGHIDRYMSGKFRQYSEWMAGKMSWTDSVQLQPWNSVAATANQRGAQVLHPPSRHTEVNINGPITVNTNATDAAGVADGLANHLQHSFVADVDGGM